MKLSLESLADKTLFKKLLAENIVTFEYRKLDGSRRNTRGTLNYTKIKNGTETKVEFGGNNKSNNAKPEQITYWDFFANGWRSPRLVGQTIIIKNIEPLNVTDDKMLKINNRLYEIYEKRESIKRRVKEIKKELNQTTKINVTYIGTLEVHDINKITKAKVELESLEEERTMLRREVERLQRIKSNTN